MIGAVILDVMIEDEYSPNLNTSSITEISVDVVSNPQTDIQSLTTIPAAMTSLPPLIVPACKVELD